MIVLAHVFPTAHDLCLGGTIMASGKGCDCTCYDCKDPACHCAIPNGFCSMLPSFFMIDYVSPVVLLRPPRYMASVYAGIYIL